MSLYRDPMWESRVMFCQENHEPNPEMEKACLEAYDNGERTTLQDRIDELRSELSRGEQSSQNG